MKFYCLILLIFVLTSACSRNTDSSSVKDNASPNPEPASFQKTPLQTFQIGSTWDRKPLTEELKNQIDTPSIGKAFSNIGKIHNYIGHGSINYIGKIQGMHLGLTNYHVAFDWINSITTVCDPKIGGQPSSFLGSIYLNSISSPMGCKRVISAWPEIDLALVEIDDFNQGLHLNGLDPLQFRFHKNIEKGLELLVAGYGDFQNEDARLTLAMDPNCKIFDSNSYIAKAAVDVAPSEDGFLKVPTQFTGCDTSTGDSGSAVYDRFSDGIVVGITWFAGDTKFKEDLTQEFLTELYNQNQSTLYFDNLSGIIPTTAIYSHLQSWLEKQDPNSIEFQIIDELLLQFSE